MAEKKQNPTTGKTDPIAANSSAHANPLGPESQRRGARPEDDRKENGTSRAESERGDSDQPEQDDGAFSPGGKLTSPDSWKTRTNG
jgi:hypothetical protein